MAYPYLISYTERDWATAGASPRSTASISWQAGDLIVVIAASEGQNTIGTPTGTGLSFTSQKSNAAASCCSTVVATALPTADGSSAISTTISNAAQQSGIGAWVFRGSPGIGSSVEQHTTTRSVNLTPKFNRPGSILCIGAFDFSAATANATIVPTPTNTRQSVDEGTSYTVYVADSRYNGSNTVAVGATGGTSVGVFSIIAIEVLGWPYRATAHNRHHLRRRTI